MAVAKQIRLCGQHLPAQEVASDCEEAAAAAALSS
eukprot:CAMPEP_0119562984 /NCGR_PEP_ID=MMETSP1352-20130426/22151_1 /TAXON_ID=265584 /ORGANISM="Stauroneis constricta, Strain CCMP1120" /LENGTH=34 /DNA_ID= /DNA_START= /DNA_END= /DNA_ORIENTATION=